MYWKFWQLCVFLKILDSRYATRSSTQRETRYWRTHIATNFNFTRERIYVTTSTFWNFHKGIHEKLPSYFLKLTFTFQLKWFRTRKLFVFYIVFLTLYAASVLGYSLTHFGEFQRTSSEDTKNFWWYFFLIASIQHNIYTLKGSFHGITSTIRAFKYVPKDIKWKDMIDFETIFTILFYLNKTIVTNTFAYIILFSNFDYESKKYFCAVNVIACCFDLMLIFGQIPGVGVFLNMMKRVSVSICRFFASYFWHFLGYAIAFHIIMPQDGAFKHVSDSIIKVLTTFNNFL